MIQDKPLFGVGFGRFHLDWEKYFHYNAKIDFTGFDGSHNTFLTMGAEVGVPTMLAFLLMNFYMVRMCSALYRKLGPEMQLEKSLLVMVMGLVSMYVVTGWFSDLRWTTVQNTLIFLLLGLVASLKQDLDRLGAKALAKQVGAITPVREVKSPPGGTRGAPETAPGWDLPGGPRPSPVAQSQGFSESL
jgi:O-antigen ligase